LNNKYQYASINKTKKVKKINTDSFMMPFSLNKIQRIAKDSRVFAKYLRPIFPSNFKVSNSGNEPVE
jgi:hypothetical protein